MRWLLKVHDLRYLVRFYKQCLHDNLTIDSQAAEIKRLKSMKPLTLGSKLKSVVLFTQYSVARIRLRDKVL